MKFYLQIELGNEEMRTGVDVSIALHKVANHVKNVGTGWSPFDEYIIKDKNGNTVGYYGVD